MFKITSQRMWIFAITLSTIATYFHERPKFDNLLRDIVEYSRYGPQENNIPFALTPNRSIFGANYVIHYPKNKYPLKIDGENITMLAKSRTGVFPVRLVRTEQDLNEDCEHNDYLLTDNRGKTFPFTSVQKSRGLKYIIYNLQNNNPKH